MASPLTSGVAVEYTEKTLSFDLATNARKRDVEICGAEVGEHLMRYVLLHFKRQVILLSWVSNGNCDVNGIVGPYLLSFILFIFAVTHLDYNIHRQYPGL